MNTSWLFSMGIRSLNPPPFRRVVERSDLVPPVTRASVIEAQLAAQIERDQIYRETGVRIHPDGHVDLPARSPR